MSYHTLSTKPLNVGLKTLLKRGGHIGLGLGAFAPMLAMANPAGGQVVAGTATISSPDANGTVIRQTSAAAIIDWQQFNIASGQYVQFLQPSSSSIILNRVIGGGGSSIYGSLTGNGQIFLVNTNGVFFGKGASIDAQGFLASTLDINNNDFLAGNFVFKKGSGAPDAQVVNQGLITAHNGGYVVLAGDYAENDGVIAATSGHVVLASGTQATLNLSGNSLISFAVNQATLAHYAGVTNAGSLIADGGTVIMTANVANALKATVVNNSGLVEARSIDKSANGIYLTATGGNIENSGTLDASAFTTNNTGGTIKLISDETTLLDPTSEIDARGRGAAGGFVDLSGHDLRMGGAIHIGRGGALLLDPGTVTIKSGTGRDMSNSFGTASVAAQLNSGVAVTILASNGTGFSGTIGHSANAHGITATGPGAGKLTLKVGEGGTIALQGFTINIKGDLSTAIASHLSPSTCGTCFVPGADANVSFGHITANNVNIQAGSGDVVLAGASGSGVNLKHSIKATGNVVVRASQLEISGGTKGLDISAASDLALNAGLGFGTSSAFVGNVNLKAGGDVAVKSMVVDGKITIAGAHIGHTGSGALALEATSNITLKGQLGSSGGSTLHRTLDINAGGILTIDHGITDVGNIDLTASKLGYTGAGALDIKTSGSGHQINLQANIGSAAARVAYNVDLSGSGISTGINVDSNIYTKGSISIGAFGVRIGGDHAITLSADDGKGSTTHDNISIGGFFVSIGGSNADATASHTNVDHSVTLHAGHDVGIGGSSVDIAGGQAHADAHGAITALSAKDDVTISAGHDIGISGSHVLVAGGEARADVLTDSKSAVTAVATANTTLIAGNDINLSANNLMLRGGSDLVRAVTTTIGQKATVTASTNLKLSAHDINASANTLLIRGGDSVGLNSGSTSGSMQVRALQAGAMANVTAHADVSLTATDAIGIGANGLTIRGGNNVAGAYASFSSSPVPHSYTIAPIVQAAGKGAKASLTATANVGFTAGAGGIVIDTSNYAHLSGGTNAGIGEHVIASASSAAATADAEAGLTLTTSGRIRISGHNVNVLGGDGAAGWLTNPFNTSTGAVVAGTKANDAVSLTAKSGVHFTAGGNLVISADASGNGRLVLAAGSYGGGGLSAELGTSSATAPGAKGTVLVDDGVSATAGGALKLLAGAGLSLSGGSKAGYNQTVRAHNGVLSVTETANLNIKGGTGVTLYDDAVGSSYALYLQGGASAGLDDFVTATKATGKATVNANAAVNVSTTKGAITVTNADGFVQLQAGYGAAQNAAISASTAATASLTADNGVHLSAPGAIAITAAGSAFLFGSESAAAHAGVHGNHATAKLTALSNVTVAAAGAFTVTAGSGVEFSASGYPAYRASVSASGAGASATLMADSGVHITAGGDVTLRAKDYMNLSGSDYAGNGATLTASYGGKATLTALSNLSITAGGNFLASAQGVSSNMDISGGYGAGGSHSGVKAKVTAHKGAATFVADASARITAKGAITLNAHHAIDINGSNSAALRAVVTASSGQAAMTALGNVAFTAGGMFTAAAGGNLTISASEDPAYAADVTAKGAGAKATLLADTGISITAGTNVNLKAGGSLGISGSVDAAYSAGVHASNGAAASVTARDAVTITAGGAFTASAADRLSIYGSNGAGYGASVTGKKGTAVLVADGGAHITAAGNISLKTLHDQIYVQAGSEVGSQALISASGDATHPASATETAFGGVNFTAGGAFTATALNSYVEFSGNSYTGEGASVIAKGAGIKSTLTADGGVRITAHGSVTLKGRSDVDLYGGNAAGYSASISASNGGVATETARSGITITAGGAFTASGATGSVDFSGGSEVGESAALTASKGAATLMADGGVHISAVGNITLNAGSYLYLEGSDYAGYSAHVTAHAGGTATETALSNVTLTAGGNITATAGSTMYLSASSEAGYSASVTAKGIGAKASLTADTGVALKAAGNVTLRGHQGLSLSGSDSAAESAVLNGSSGGVAVLNASAALNITAGGNLIASGGSKYVYFSAGTAAGESATVKANHGTAILTADGGVHVKVGGSVSVLAGSFIEAFGAAWAGDGASVSADHGKAVANVTNALTINAGGNFTASVLGVSSGSSHRPGFLSISGGRGAGYGAAVTAKGAGATATLNADTGAHIKVGGNIALRAAGYVSVSGGNSGARSANVSGSAGGVAKETALTNVDLIAGGAFIASAGTSYLEFFGGNKAAYNTTLTATKGSATLIANSGINVNAKGAVSLHAGTFMSIAAGTEAASAAHATATGSAGAKATLAADSSLNVSGANITLTAGSNMSISGGGNAAKVAVAKATTGATAKITATSRVNIVTPGSFLAQAADYLEVNAGSNGAYGATASANAATAAITADDGVAIKAGRTLSLGGGTGMSVGGDDYNGRSASALAVSHGVATVKTSARIDITAGGALTMDGGSGNLSISGNYYNGWDAFASGSKGGVASVTADASLNIHAASVSLTAGSYLSVYANSGNAYGAGASATTKGKATVNANASVNITTPGAFTATAGSNMEIFVASSNGRAAHLSANGASAAALVNANNSVNISALSVTLAANGSGGTSGGMFIYGGSRAAYSASLTAKNHGVATEIMNAAVNITAVKSITAQLTGGSSSQSLQIHGGNSGAKSAGVTASSAGRATLSDNNGVNLKVTGLGGAITLQTGPEVNASLSIYAGNYNAKSASVDAHVGGVATLTANDGVNLTAPGTITVAANHGELSIYGGFAGVGQNAVTVAGGAGAAATINDTATVNIKGATVNLAASGSLDIYGGWESAGRHASVNGDSGGVAKTTIDTTANITAAGNINVTAGGSMYVFGGYRNDGRSANVQANAATASLTITDGSKLAAGGNITLTGARSVYVYGASGGGLAGAALVSGSAAGKASLTVTGNVSIAAGRAFTAKANDDLYVYGGSYVARYELFGASSSLLIGARALANGANASAKFTAQANVSITAGGPVTLAAGSLGFDSLFVHGGNAVASHADVAGSAGGVATMDAEGKVSIKSGGALTAVAGGFMSFEGKASAGHDATVSGVSGTGALVTNTGVSLTVGGNLALNLLSSGNLSIIGGDNAGVGATATGSNATGKATVILNQNVVLSAAGTVTVNGANDVTLSAGTFPATGSDVNIVKNAGGAASATVNSSVLVTGTAVTVHHLGSFNKNSHTGVTTGGLTEIGTAKTVIHAAATALRQSTLTPRTMSVQMTPADKVSAGSANITPAVSGDVSIGSGLQFLTSDASIPLSTLMGDGIVLNLLPVLAHPQSIEVVHSGVDFTPTEGIGSHSGGGDCRVTLVQDHGSRCSIR